MIMQAHDELVLEVRVKLPELMTDKAKLKVLLVAETGVGRNLDEASNSTALLRLRYSSGSSPGAHDADEGRLGFGYQVETVMPTPPEMAGREISVLILISDFCT